MPKRELAQLNPATRGLIILLARLTARNHSDSRLTLKMSQRHGAIVCLFYFEAKYGPHCEPPVSLRSKPGRVMLNRPGLSLISRTPPAARWWAFGIHAKLRPQPLRSRAGR